MEKRDIGRRWVAVLVIGLGLMMIVGLPAAILLSQPDARAHFPEPGIYPYPVETSPVPSTETLQWNIDGAILGTVLIEGTQAGPPSGSATTTLWVRADPGSYIRIGTLTLDGGTCESLIMEDVYAFNLSIVGNTADGKSLTLTPTSTASDIVIESTRGETRSVISRADPYDRIIIQGGTGATIRSLTITGFDSRGGDCRLTNLRVGTLSITGWTVGKGDGLAAADLDLDIRFGNIATSTDNIETTVDVR